MNSQQSIANLIEMAIVYLASKEFPTNWMNLIIDLI
jgi:hypothetical protein